MTAIVPLMVDRVHRATPGSLRGLASGDGDALPSLGVLKDWVEESYRLVAPEPLAARIDA